MFAPSKFSVKVMKKKVIILSGIGIILLTLLMNINLSKDSESDLSFINIEALAQQEGGSSATCVSKGSVCWGVNSAGEIGVFPGLAIKE